jgi:hypothetical protein
MNRATTMERQDSATTWSSQAWEEVWAEYDARHATKRAKARGARDDRRALATPRVSWAEPSIVQFPPQAAPAPAWPDAPMPDRRARAVPIPASPEDLGVDRRARAAPVAAVPDCLGVDRRVRGVQGPSGQAEAMADRRARPRGAFGTDAAGRRSAWGMAGQLVVVMGLSIGIVNGAGPIQAARELLSAAERRDETRLGAQVDWAAVNADQTERLGSLAETAAERRGGADAFLRGMAQDVAGGVGNSAGLLAAMHHRLGPVEHGGWRVASVEADGLWRLRINLRGAAPMPEEGEDAGTGPSVSLTLALTDPWRLAWRMVAFELQH